jgi:hypothetical protein
LALLAISKITDSGKIKVNESLDEVAANATEADATSADDNINARLKFLFNTLCLYNTISYFLGSHDK